MEAHPIIAALSALLLARRQWDLRFESADLYRDLVEEKLQEDYSTLLPWPHSVAA